MLGVGLIVALLVVCADPQVAPPDQRQAEGSAGRASRLDALGGGGWSSSRALHPGLHAGPGGPCYASERPAHSVELTRRVWVAKTELTQAQYEAVTGQNPNKHLGAEHPVEQLEWFEALAFANALLEAGLLRGLRQRLSWPKGLDCLGFRLPTEAEWSTRREAARTACTQGVTPSRTWAGLQRRPADAASGPESQTPTDL